MLSDLDIKHQPGSLLAGRVGLHAHSYTSSSSTGHAVLPRISEHVYTYIL